MTNTAAPFKQIDVTRAVKGMAAAGVEVGAAIIEPGGRIVVVARGQDMPTGKTDIDKMLGT